MSLLDDYQNFQEENLDGAGAAADPTAQRKNRAEIERRIVILNSDLKKTLREIEELELQRRKFKKQEERLRVDEDALDKTLKKMQDDARRLEEEIGGLKKKLKILR